ncbi:hypothetical protein C5167_022233 [Papaver somniferum]|uniref:peptidylprolyl isomerase n=1 Tax=Papaver somniferum TaxID=3469 RepID=A0A4Y7JKB3_PAPSO|nr:peptidyl-prolyl cis-trans isomerase FKBP19, chloroplastic-like [Papaver somniferum]RZC60480.1 hypothetical protein C5167_022233 [Papaver somniferum]
MASMSSPLSGCFTSSCSNNSRSSAYPTSTTVMLSPHSLGKGSTSSSVRVIEWNISKRSLVRKGQRCCNSVVSMLKDVLNSGEGNVGRREALFSSTGIVLGVLYRDQESRVAVASEFADMPALRGKDYGKSKMKYPDYVETESGLQYKDLRPGKGPTAKMGDAVVVDWDGFTIGYYGRIFEARNKTKGGSFEGDEKEFFKFKVGSQQVIPAFEEAIIGMAPGGVRRIIVPPELGYPDNDYNNKGPQPTTFSGQRALDFVLKNQGLIDKTLLFDIELLKIVTN